MVRRFIALLGALALTLLTTSSSASAVGTHGALYASDCGQLQIRSLVPTTFVVYVAQAQGGYIPVASGAMPPGQTSVAVPPPQVPETGQALYVVEFVGGLFSIDVMHPDEWSWDF